MLWQHDAPLKARAPTTATTLEKQVWRLASARKLLRAHDVTQQGLPAMVLTRHVQAGKLEGGARGVYGLPGAKIKKHRPLVEVSIRVRKGVVCLVYLLRVKEIGTLAPFEDWIPTTQHKLTPRLDPLAVHAVRTSDGVLADGVDHFKTDGVDVPVFNAAGPSSTNSGSETRSVSTWHLKPCTTAGWRETRTRDSRI